MRVCIYLYICGVCVCERVYIILVSVDWSILWRVSLVQTHLSGLQMHYAVDVCVCVTVFM